MRRIVVCDTGPLLHLTEAGAIHLLQRTGKIIIPPMVANKFEENFPVELPDWILTVDLDPVFAQKARAWVKQIDPGEAAAIALSLQTKADWLLSDDAIARQFAESLGLEVHGSVGVLLWGAATGHIPCRDEAVRLLEALADSSLWVSNRVINHARKTIDLLYSE